MTVALCCLVGMMEGIDLQAPGLTVPVLGALFHMSPGVKGWFMSISTFGLMLGAAVGGRLSDRIGRKWVLILSAAMFGLMSLATAWSTGIELLLTARFLTGVGLGGALPNVISLVAENVSQERRYTAVGILYASLPTGGALASVVATLLAGPDQWRAVYLVGGAGPLLVIPALALVLPNVRPAVPVRPDGASAQGLYTALFGERRAVGTMSLWVGFFFALLIMYLLLGWLPSLMLGRGLTRSQASMVQIAFNAFGVLGSTITGLLLDRINRAAGVAAVFALTGIALVYLADAPAELGASLLAGALIGLTMAGTQTVLYSLAPGSYPTAVRGTGVGMAVAAGRLGSAVGPILAGVLIGAGHTPREVVFSLLPFLIAAGAAAMLVAVRSGRNVK